MNQLPKKFLEDNEFPSEEQMDSYISKYDNSFIFPDPIDFDQMGRHCIYDSVTFRLLSKPGLMSSIFLASSIQASYNFYHFIPYTANYFYGAAGLASILTMKKINGFAANQAQISRLYLMSDMKQVMIQNGFGQTT